MSEDQEKARQELIKRGVIKETEPTPAPTEEPRPPEKQAASWLCLIRHRWKRWELIQVTLMMGEHAVGEKTHQRRECRACGKAEIVAVFL